MKKMDKKQIEEIKQLARDIFERGTALDGIDFVHAAVNGADRDDTHFMRIARHLYCNKGYRKASEVAREIFAEIEENMTDIKMEFATLRAIGKRHLAKIKEKYESEDTE